MDGFDKKFKEYPPRIQKLIEDRNLIKLKNLIEKGGLEITKELLKLKNSIGYSLAHYLIKSFYKIDWIVNDKEILMIQNNEGDSVAHLLAEYHPTWTIKDLDILKLKNKQEKTVKDILVERKKSVSFNKILNFIKIEFIYDLFKQKFK